MLSELTVSKVPNMTTTLADLNATFEKLSNCNFRMWLQLSKSDCNFRQTNLTS